MLRGCGRETIEFDLDSLLSSQYLHTETASIKRTFIFYDSFMPTISKILIAEAKLKNFST